MPESWFGSTYMGVCTKQDILIYILALSPISTEEESKKLLFYFRFSDTSILVAGRERIGVEGGGWTSKPGEYLHVSTPNSMASEAWQFAQGLCRLFGDPIKRWTVSYRPSVRYFYNWGWEWSTAQEIKMRDKI